MTVLVDEIGGVPVHPYVVPMPGDSRARRVADALVVQPDDVRGLQAWARSEAVSARTLSRRFVEETGFTFSQ